MEIRKTNLGVEYELEAYETGRSSVKVLAYFPQSIEFEQFEIKGLSDVEVSKAYETDDVSFLTDEQLSEAQQYINEKAIMYVSAELAKLMAEVKFKSFTVDVESFIQVVLVLNNNLDTKHANGLQQIEKLIKQIRYGS